MSVPIVLPAALAAAIVCATLLAGCGKKLSDTATKPPAPLAPSPSAIVIGQVPDETKTETETPVVPARTASGN